MNSSEKTTRSAPSARAFSRAARAFAALPATSPTVGFNWASVILNSTSLMVPMVPCTSPNCNRLLQIAPMRSAMANSQNRPPITSATPTAADPISLTRPICGSWSVVRRSASFSIAVLRSSTTSTRTTAATSSTRRIAVTPISHASGSEIASAAISSRTACSDRIAKARPFRVLIVARQNLSKSKTRCGRHRLDLAGAFLLQQFRDQESHVDRLFRVQTGIADRVIAVVEILVGDGARAADTFGDVLPGHLQMHAAGVGALGLMDREERFHLRQHPVERTGLVTRRRGDGVAVHRIARPD